MVAQVCGGIVCAEASSQYSGANNLRLNALFIKFAVDNLAITGIGDMRVTQYPVYTA